MATNADTTARIDPENTYKFGDDADGRRYHIVATHDRDRFGNVEVVLMHDRKKDEMVIASHNTRQSAMTSAEYEYSVRSRGEMMASLRGSSNATTQNLNQIEMMEWLETAYKTIIESDKLHVDWLDNSAYSDEEREAAEKLATTFDLEFR